MLFISTIIIAQTPIGSEFQVNTYITGDQSNSSIAIADNGDFIIVWESEQQDSSNGSIYAQCFDSSGNTIGIEFRVNTHVENTQRNPDIAMSGDGSFVVTWMSNLQDSSGMGIYAQRFNNNGTPQGSEFRVNTYILDDQFLPEIAMNNNGEFVIVWVSESQNGNTGGVYAKRYNNSGIPQGSEFQINNLISSPDIVMDNNGNFIVVANGFDSDGADIYAKRYNSNNVPLGNSFIVNTNKYGDQINPSIAITDNGNFVVTWQDKSWLDGDRGGIFAKRFNSNGISQGTNFQVNTYTQRDQTTPNVAIQSNGSFIITWVSYLQDGFLLNVYGQ